MRLPPTSRIPCLLYTAHKQPDFAHDRMRRGIPLLAPQQRNHEVRARIVLRLCGYPQPAGSPVSYTQLTSSLTLLMTGCDAEYLFWLLNNATMKYALESFSDYAATPNQPDPLSLIHSSQAA